jgi:uncharacterized protein with NRDE domain
MDARGYVGKVEKDSGLYNGFNLVVGDVRDGFWYMGNRPENSLKELDAGTVYGISNGGLENGEEWPKVTRGKMLFDDIIKVWVNLTI